MAKVGAIIVSIHKVVVQIKQTNPCKALWAWPDLNCWFYLHLIGGEREGAWENISGGTVNPIRPCSHVKISLNMFSLWLPQGNPSNSLRRLPTSPNFALFFLAVAFFPFCE